MTMTKACTSKSTSSPRRSPRLFNKYMKPGALAKLRDSKINAARNNQQRTTTTTQIIALSEMLLLTPTSPSSPTQQYNEDNGVPCFDSAVNLHRPGCLSRKKLFAVTPTFTHTDTNYHF
ncbi:hypothetical protein AAZX31_13G066500 [Glycine max]|uniref:Uncharacterized protein n=1 Tax=Glycine soja TaxID=3848 RepID=A0A445HCU1_GLYSO|nr:hypothetical protein GLYMA_13G082350v4 [Glycine max]KAH1100387.1 hypothetical protein GYH30_035519 [Glycine max]RZB71431.1 hypothetical protein D0Y65_036078 [Glycine soja]